MDRLKREKTGSFYTPQIWVELSQRYLADVLGDHWQDEYYIWDCAAGTGNLLAGLTNKDHIFASTLDRQDVDVMRDRIQNGANLWEKQVFQFDFLNDSFDKLPMELQEIINDPEKRKKLVIYINPPYAEASNKKTLQSRKEGNRAVEQSLINKKYANLLGQANAELFAQFFTRIYFEIEGCLLANFSTMKILSGQHFIDFRNFFLAKLKKCMIIPAHTFDNVNGAFAIGFMIWETHKKEKFKKIRADVYNKDGKFAGTKNYFAYENSQYMNDWIKPFRAEKSDKNVIGKFPFAGNDFQHQDLVQIMHHQMAYSTAAGQFLVNPQNLIFASIYFAVRKCIKMNWLNNQDQFLFPNNKWKKDLEFQNNCLVYTLFTNKMQSKYGTNHWIPFTEQEVNSSNKFESQFMSKFIRGKIKMEGNGNLLENEKNRSTALIFSLEAQAVFDAGREIWKYYHFKIKEPTSWGLSEKMNVDASFYDIREYFQGRNEKGRMNSSSTDEKYTALMAILREKMQILASKIEPKIYEYGFLKE